MERPFFGYGSMAAQRAQQMARTSGRRIRQTARSQFQHWNGRLKSVVADNPAASLGVALAAGVVLGWLVKRR